MVFEVSAFSLEFEDSSSPFSHQKPISPFVVLNIDQHHGQGSFSLMIGLSWTVGGLVTLGFLCGRSRGKTGTV